MDLMTQFRHWTEPARTTVRHKLSHSVLHQADNWSLSRTVAEAAAAGRPLGGAWLPQARLAGLKAPGLYVASADMTGALLDEAQVQGGTFARATLTDVSARGISAEEGDFSQAVIVGMRADRGDFRGALFNDAQAGGFTARRADFTGTQWQGTQAEDCILDGSHLTDSEIDGTRFDGGSLRAVKMRGSRVNASMVNCDCRDLDLTGAEVQQLDLSGADVAGLRLPRTVPAEHLTLTGARNLDRAVLVDDQGKAIPGLMLSERGIARRPSAQRLGGR